MFLFTKLIFGKTRPGGFDFSKEPSFARFEVSPTPLRGRGADLLLAHLHLSPY